MSISQKTKRPLVLAAVMLAMFMAAVEATIVATAMPGIVADLGGFSHFSWVFSSYLLMQVVTIPIYGKLADIYGRKRIFSSGIGVFLVGSLLCGFSSTMTMLIVSRFLQGIGAGAVQPIAQTIVGDMYTKEERANIQGYLSSIWGVSAIIGPLLGALFINYTHWAWVFWVNIPFGIVAIAIILLYLHENVEKKKQSVDLIGAVLLFISVAVLMFVLVQFERSTFILFTAISVVTFLLFILHERKVANPIITLSLWRKKEIKYANLTSFTAGAMLLAVSTFLPTYVQGVLGKSPLIAGLTLTMMSVGWPISSMIAGKMMLKTGFRVTALIGGGGLVVGAIIYFTLPLINHPLWAGLGSLILGAGLGFSTTTFIVLIQSTVSWNVRGEATAMNMFMRLLGGAVGVALLGGILNRKLRIFFEQEGASLSFQPTIDTVSSLLSAKERTQFSADELELLQAGLSTSLSAVFVALLGLAVISLIFITLLPQDGVTRKKNESSI